MERVAFLTVMGDGYPSVESYWERNGVVTTAIRDREGFTAVGVPVPLIPIYLDRDLRYEASL